MANQCRCDRNGCHHQVQYFNQTLGPRLAQKVSERLGVDVAFLRWDKDVATSADVPVFSVPAGMEDTARALGLRVATR